MKPTVSPLTTLQRVSILTISILLLGVSPAQALTFNFLRNSNTTESDYNLALPAFTAAGQRWAENFSDDVTINLQVGYAALGSGILGSTSTSSGTASYSVFRAALSTDAGSSDDHSMVSHLPGQSVAMLINRTSNNPNGAGSATPYLDNNASANNSTIRLTSANAKALGLLAANHAGLDGSITFSNNFNAGQKARGHCLRVPWGPVMGTTTRAMFPGEAALIRIPACGLRQTPPAKRWDCA